MPLRRMAPVDAASTKPFQEPPTGHSRQRSARFGVFVGTPAACPCLRTSPDPFGRKPLHRNYTWSMVFSWAASQQAFTDAAQWFVCTSHLVGDRWDAPGLGEWNIRDLCGHTSRALLTVETYLARPATDVDVPSPAEYFRSARALAAGPEVAARGREAGTALGPDPAGSIASIAARVLPLLAARDGSELIGTISGGMRLRDYLPTRTFELAIHTLDLSKALGLPTDVPDTAASQALEIVADLAVAGGLAGSLLLAATGRPVQPEGFTVL